MVNYVYNVKNLYYNRSCFSSKSVVSVDLLNTPWVNNSMDNAFRYCYYLNSVKNINEHVINMDRTFFNCYRLLETPIIPSSVQTMTSTFFNCTNLTTMPTIPDGVQSMESTFENCNKMTTLKNIPGSVEVLNWTFYRCSSMTTPPIIEDGVKKLSYTFRDCFSLNTPPTIPSSVTDLLYTFGGCYCLVTPPTIPSGVINMQMTFIGCKTLASTPNIPNSVLNMHSCYSYDCWNVNMIGTMSQSAVNLYNTFYGVGSGTYNVDALNVVIPNTVENTYNLFVYSGLTNKLPSIADNCPTLVGAFRGCDRMETTPTFLGNCYNISSCFDSCNNMTTAYIPNGVINGAYAFYYCNKLSTIMSNIPKTTTNVSFMFACTNITSTIFVESESITCASWFVAQGPYGSAFNHPVNVYIPFQNNGDYTTTYNSFIEANYKTNGAYLNVYIKDINSMPYEVDDTEYRVTQSGTTLYLNAYIGTNVNVKVPRSKT